MAFKTMQALIFLGLFASSCLAQAPAPAPMTFFPPVESPSPVLAPTAESPSPVALPPVSVDEPTPAPTTAPTVAPPTMSPTTSPVASPPESESLAPGPSGPASAPAPAPQAEVPTADSSAFTNKAFFVSTLIAGALYAVVLA